MAQQRSTEIKVGIFVIVCLAIIAAMIIRFGKYTRFAENTYEITVAFPNVGGIVKDASVQYGGINVGKVRQISLDQEGLLKVHVKLAIYEGVKIRKDSKFVINQAGLLGDRYIDIIPQSGTAEFLKPGDSIEGATSVDLSEAIRSVVDVLRQTADTIQRVDTAIQRIDETVLSRPSLERIRSAMANIDLATSNTVALTLGLRGLVEDNRPRVDHAITLFSDAAENFNSASKRVDDLLESNQQDIRTTVNNFAEAAQRLNLLLGRLEKGEGTAGKILVDPTLHDEIVRLVQNWRRHGLLYKERTRPDDKIAGTARRAATPVPARPAQAAEAELIFGTDLTNPIR